jgi:hypothetical protein
MSVTVEQTVRDLRAAVRDETGTEWDATVDLLPRINEALMVLYVTRPDAFYVSAVIVAEPSTIAAVTGDMPVRDHYVPAVVARAAYALLLNGQRDGDADLARSNFDKWTMIVYPRRR